VSLSLSRRTLIWALPLGAVLLAGTGFAARMMEPPPADLDLALSKTSTRGLYRVTLAADRDPVPVGAMHAWTVKVTTADGHPVDGTIAIDGGMPQHGHGLPTRPQVTTDLGGGSHLIEGMKFSMPGWWTLTVSVDAAGGADNATFNLML
jgi:hypothetical protein